MNLQGSVSARITTSSYSTGDYRALEGFSLWDEGDLLSVRLRVQRESTAMEGFGGSFGF